MNLSDIIRVVRGVWDSWDVRGFMLLSFCLQTCLAVLAPLRTRTSNNWLIATLFCIYLLADWAANYAAGVISSSVGDDPAKTHKNEQPLAFWCTFLLVHLGGPDSITAFSLQDNDFWHRHALTILFQCISSTYIFFRTLRYNHLWIPTLLVFVSGFIKYYERTLSLYSASFNNLRDSLRKAPDPGPSYSKIMRVYTCQREANLPTRLDFINAPPRAIKKKSGCLEKCEEMPYAYHFFEMIKRLVVDIKCSQHERQQSRLFFLGRTAEEAFKLIAIELNFLYDILFTKAGVLYTREGLGRRLFSFALMVASLGLFYCEDKGKGFSPSDVCISYTLFLGAIAFDVASFINLITTDWVVALTKKVPDANWFILGGDTPPPRDNTEKKPRFFRLSGRRWSESVSGLGLIEYCLSARPAQSQKIMDCLGVTSHFDGLKYVKGRRFSKELRDLIFEEVKSRSHWAEDWETARAAIKARGDCVLRLVPDCSHLLCYVVDVDYDRSLLSWHIATELCWYDDDNKDSPHRELAKILSDYMMYLVIMQPAIMYGVTDIGQTRLRDTCAEIKKELSPSHDQKEPPSTFQINKYGVKCLGQGLITFTIRIFYKAMNLAYKCKNQQVFSGEEENLKRFCKSILAVNTEFKPVLVKGDKSKSVLFDACRLAKEIKGMEDRKWEIVSRVWVEMLTYAAVHCRPQTLAPQLSRGGELITFVWLLMAHFGMVDQFEPVDIDALHRAKIIVGK